MYWCEYKKEPWQHVIWTRWCITIPSHCVAIKEMERKRRIIESFVLWFSACRKGNDEWTDALRPVFVFFYNPYLAQMMLVSHFILFNIKAAPHTVYNYMAVPAGATNKKPSWKLSGWPGVFWVETKKKEMPFSFFFFMHVVVECTGDGIYIKCWRASVGSYSRPKRKRIFLAPVWYRLLNSKRQRLIYKRRSSSSHYISAFISLHVHAAMCK